MARRRRRRCQQEYEGTCVEGGEGRAENSERGNTSIPQPKGGLGGQKEVFDPSHCTTEFTAMNQEIANNQSESKPSRRPNRPGFNSYLKVLLDDTTMDHFHQVAIQIQQELVKHYQQQQEQQQREEKASEQRDDQQLAHQQKQEGQQQEGQQQDDQEKGPEASSDTNNSKDKKKKGRNKPVTFKPRSRNSLHMTLFFGGEIVCELPVSELEAWHLRVSQRLKQSGFGNKACRSEVFEFEVTDIKVFPPHRNNLVVAILEPTPAWHLLHDDLRKIAQDPTLSAALADVTAYSKPKWISHITLGNLFGGTKADVKALLNPLLQDVFRKRLAMVVPIDNRSSSSSSSNKGWTALTSGIAMGGPIPKQKELNWDFPYSPDQA